MSGRYTSYWIAFLFNMIILKEVNYLSMPDIENCWENSMRYTLLKQFFLFFFLICRLIVTRGFTPVKSHTDASTACIDRHGRVT